MSALDITTQQELLELLSPLLEREPERRALLASALGADCPLLQRIEWGGTVEPFVLRMSEALARFGELRPGQQALWTLLQATRDRVSLDREARIDALEPIINRPAAAEALLSSSARESGAAPLHLRVFLASPGDVADERALARQVLERLPYDPLLRGQVTIESVAWDQPGAGVPMLATMNPQAAIAAGLPKPSECDIVVVIFWARMGRPLPAEYRKPDGSAYLSGTEWEYLDALAAATRGGKPQILVYRRTEKFLLDSDDPEFDDKRAQRERVKAFFASFYNPDSSIRSGYNEYAAPEDFRQQLDLHLRSVIRRLQQDRSQVQQGAALRTTAAPTPALWQGSPFPGLRAFTPDDAPIFFGRGRETDELLRRLSHPSTRLLVVVGASGSGKSSLVAAGLLPRLKDNAIEGSKDWVLPHVIPPGEGARKQWAGLRFTPGELGDNPFLAFAAKLTPLLPDDALTPRMIVERLQTNPGTVNKFLEEILRSKARWAELLIFVDQSEELFSVTAERYREPFVAMLAAATRMPRARIVMTARADFFERCLGWPTLAVPMCALPFALATPGLVALFEMITGPAARAGLTFEENLPARILEDAGTSAGSLPLLAFALQELYEAAHKGKRLTHSVYARFGGVRGAITKRAEATFARLPADAQQLMPDVFRELVEIDANGVATRRRARCDRVLSTPQARALVDAFTDARLLVTDRGPDGSAVVEVAHEALLSEWSRLKNWIADIQDGLRLWRHAETAAAEWERAGRAPTFLWPHERLMPVHAALEQLGIHSARLDEPVKTFVRPEAGRLLDELARPETSHYRRAEIGDRLDRIGDPRPGVELRADGLPDIVWCDIPGGTVELEDVKRPFHVGKFLMSKYLVTHRQYQAFRDDPEGYANESWWRESGHDPDLGEQYRPMGNCPAENVSWYEAMAYCRWLTARFGYEVQLPTEWEWQQAAIGANPGNQYPWGPHWDSDRANTDESHLGRTTAVGMYPLGASSQGVHDIAGNVWEWCLNIYSKPRSVSISGEDWRALRGGSWASSRLGALCMARNVLDPSRLDSNVGFRLVRAAPAR